MCGYFNGLWHEDDPPCAVCQEHVDVCECPQCYRCGYLGDPACYNAGACGGLVIVGVWLDWFHKCEVCDREFIRVCDEVHETKLCSQCLDEGWILVAFVG